MKVKGSDWCSLIDYDKDGEKKILAAALYRFDEVPYADALKYVKSLKKKEREKLAETLLGKLGKYDVPCANWNIQYARLTSSWTRARMPNSNAIA
ncbi:MAG: hypothetical protein IPG44_00765 [Anaerolineales bacterium]|nr:hypothetical protein [Anaerolineales bacterium]